MNWSINMEEIKVSINCLVYNHGKYLRECLDGILMQQTDFKYEVLIHDDASTDDSVDIIREYEIKYPNIIKPIYQTENQYSKGLPIATVHQYPRALGKYIAFCEGDDYWIDSHKLQKQVDYMDSHIDCTFCFTNGYIEDLKNGNKRRPFVPYNDYDAKFFRNENKEYDLNNMHEITFAPTASFFIRCDALAKAIELYDGPCPTADLRMRLYTASFGYAYYINDKTCVYRQNVPDSAMSSWKNYDRKKVFEHNKKIISMIDRLDSITGKKYSEGLFKISKSFITYMIFNASSLKILKDDRNKRVFRSLPISMKTKAILRILTPDRLLHFLKQIRGGWKES